MQKYFKGAFKKYVGNPILSPTGSGWESMAVLCPAVIVENGIFYMFYRGDDWTYVRWIENQPLPKDLADQRWKGGKEKGGWACIGLAYSVDGINFERYRDNPVIVPEHDWEKTWGCEESRIVKIDDTYILTYRGGGRYVALATSKDLIHWEKKGICLPDWESTNSGAVVPEKINGKYVMYHGDSNIWVAYSEDLLHWESPREPVMKPREGYFDDSLVESGPPPIVTEDGIVLIYHGRTRETWAYSLGVVVFSKEEPSKILYRSDRPFLEPTEEWEINGKAYEEKIEEGCDSKKVAEVRKRIEMASSPDVLEQLERGLSALGVREGFPYFEAEGLGPKGAIRGRVERAAYRNLVLGLGPPETARFRNPYHEWIGAGIRADIYGYICPGGPELAADMAYRDATLSHVKNGVYFAMFVSATLSAAFVVEEPREAVEVGLSEIPKGSRLAEAIRYTLELHAAGVPWEEAWERLSGHYGHYHPVHSIPNATFVVSGLLWGEGDFTKMVSLSVMCGFDTDCNGATAGSIMGARGIPQRLSMPLNDTLVLGLAGFGEARILELAKRTLEVRKWR